MSVKKQLLLLLISVTSVPMLAILLLSSFLGKDALLDSQKEKLEALSVLKKENVERFFSDAVNDIENIANQPAVISTFNDGLGPVVANLQGAGIAISEMVSMELFQNYHDEIDPFFNSFLNRYGYRDFFLISRDGNVIYTAKKRGDFGTNLTSDSTQLTRIWKSALAGGEVSLSELSLYRYADNKPALFLSSPVQEGDSVLGVIVLELPLDMINQVVNNDVGLGEKGESYLLLGEEKGYQFLTETRFLNEKWMQKLLKSKEGSSSVLTLSNDSRSARSAFDGMTGIIEDSNYRGVQVLSAFTSIKALNQRYLLLVEMNKSEIMGPIYMLWFLLSIFSAVIIAIAVKISQSFGKRIAQPIESLEKYLSEITQVILEVTTVVSNLANGDWTAKLKTGSLEELKEHFREGAGRKDEIGGMYSSGTSLLENTLQMKDSLENMIEHVSSTLIEITTITERVAQGGLQIDDSSQGLSYAATEQAATVEELNSASIDLLNSAVENMKKVDNALSVNRHTEESAKGGQRNMNRLVGAMNEIEGSSEQIQKIVKVIDDIAFQTHLLALNAAVESARAGVHGKGFAVVADEVRSLSARSAKAVKEIGSIVKMNNEKISQGSEITTETVNRLDEIIQEILKTVSIMEEISSSSAEQKNMVGQISEGLDQVSISVQKVSAISEENASGSAELSSLSSRLATVVSQFTVDSDDFIEEEVVSPEEQLLLPEPEELRACK